MLRNPETAYLVSDEEFDRQLDELGWSPDAMAVSYTHLDVYKRQVEMYKELFLDRKKSVHRKQTDISYDMYCRLARILPLLSDDMSVPAFLDNVLAHHLETYSEELGELFRRKTPKTF